MKRLFLSMILTAACMTAAYAQETARVETKTMESRYFPFDREIFIYTPENYDEATETDFDVIYVFDSQWLSRFSLVYSLMHYGCQNEDENVLPYIVVGVPSTYIPEQNDRGRDFLPEPEHLVRPEGYCNSANFKKFLKDEVIPYVNDNYRTTRHSLAIGHSLGASFILDCLATDEMFDDYIALSPNLEWDEGHFGSNLMNYDFNNGKPRYIRITMANESEETGWGPDWRPAWDKVKNHFENTTLPDYIKMSIVEYPQYSHNHSYQPALLDCLGEYAEYCHHYLPESDMLYPVHFELTSENFDGDLYITGNQEALADWTPKGVKLNKTGDNTYSIDLNLKLPAEFKFTPGSWEKQMYMKNAMGGNLRITNPENADKNYTGSVY